ncbi:hypothetical protein B0H10DRAFT_2211113 [Mycena sp. CBHHK59/15]|nr:hypothetical protein B0H10DRAFT_2211113 [Mycena sp. CBHHK59/15]
MRKANESREAADISAELWLQIEAEAEKRRASNLATKSLKAQLKATKEASGKRGKSVTATPLLPEFSSVGLAMDSTFDFLGDFNWNLDISAYSSNFDSSDIGGLFVQDVPNGVLLTFEPTFFGLATDTCNTVIPSNFDTPAVDPLDDFFASYGFTASSTDLGTIIDPGFASAGPSVAHAPSTAARIPTSCVPRCRAVIGTRPECPEITPFSTRSRLMRD